jgi:hypothetical protein
MGDQRSEQTNSLESSRQRSTALAAKPPFVAQGHAHPLLQLQRQLGNRAVTHLIQTNLIQAKLSVSQPNDRYEQEADRTADTVMRMPDPIVQRQPSEEEAIQAASIGSITPLMQRQVEEEKEPVQMLQRQAEEEKEPVQMLQRQKEEKEPIQMVQRQEEEKDPIQAKATHTPDVSANLETQIQSMRGGGQPLPASTRDFFEPRFGYDFSGVRVHTDSQANDAARQLNAQAFTLRQDVFFGAGYYQPDTFQGRSLLAHELTHTVQQQPHPLRSVQTPVQAKSAIASNSEVRSPSSVGIQRRSLPISTAMPQVQRSVIDDALDWIADKAAYIPGYTLLTVIIGRNPINNRRIDPTPTNLLQGVLELVPVVGRLLFQALQASGALDRVFNWVRQEIGQLNLTWDAIMAAFRRVDLSWDDAFSPSAAYRRFEREFAPIIDRVVRFARSVKDRVITFIKEAILIPVSNFAKRLPIYPLLTVILGKDPITDEEVPRTATNVIRGILLLLPGGEERFQNLQRSGIIDRAFNWFNQELNRLNLTWNFIKSVFARVWDALSVTDLLSPIVAFNRIVGIFSEPVQRVISFAGSAIRKVAEFIFEGVLTLAGGLGQRVLSIFNRARSVISTIIENPIGFVGNLVNAVKRGFQQFAQRDRLLNHLRTGLVAWLLGSLRGSGLQLPERFDLRGIVSLVMQILGLTYANLRGILVRLAGEETVSRAEGIFGFLVTLVRDGLAAAWQQIVEFAGNLQETVMGGIRDWVTRTVVGQAVARLVTLFNPAGAIIQAIMAVYNTVVFFIERASQIGALAEAVFNSIATIASGNISAAANFVEQSMARAIPVILGFLARFIGLGGISDQIRNIIRRIQTPINNAMERVGGWIVTQVRRLGGFATQAVSRVLNFFGVRTTFAATGGEAHSIYYEDHNGEITLVVASSPKSIQEFLHFYINQNNITPRSPKGILIEGIRNFVSTQIEPVIRQVNQAKRNRDTATEQAKQQELLQKNTLLSQHLRELLAGDREVGRIIDSYLLEGTTGTYSSIPNPTTDELTPDHQPQAAILVWAAARPFFGRRSNMAQRALGRAARGYAINLHVNRHMAGRTFGTKGDQTKNNFITRANAELRGLTTNQEKRDVVVNLVREDLNEDVRVIKGVANRNNTNVVWADIHALPISQEEKNNLINTIRGNILRGEDQIANQDLESLKS